MQVGDLPVPAKATISKLTGIITTIAVCVAARGQQSVPGPAGLNPKVDTILTRLEQRTIVDLQAKVSWTVTDKIAASNVIRTGSIWYRDMKPAAKFLVAFNKKTFANRVRKLSEKHMFDGQWYVELQEATKTMTRKQLRHKNQIGDPYALGEGIFPLPFGQKKADILKEFEVKLKTSDPADPPNTDRLRLTPRPGTKTGDRYVWIDFWVLQAGKLGGLPIRVRLGKKEGTGRVSEEITVDFSDVKLNKGIGCARGQA